MYIYIERERYYTITAYNRLWPTNTPANGKLHVCMHIYMYVYMCMYNVFMYMYTCTCTCTPTMFNCTCRDVTTVLGPLRLSRALNLKRGGIPRSEGSSPEVHTLAR